MTWHSDIPEEYRNQIVTGDARELAKRIPDESVDLIFTDPVYDRIDDYRWLAETATRVLKPGGSLLVWVTQEHLLAQSGAISEYLSWSWLFSILLAGRRIPIWKKSIIACGQLLSWWSKQPNYQNSFVDDFMSDGYVKGQKHKWSKGISSIYRYTDAMTCADSIIFDPFTGGGSVLAVCKMLQRNYIAFEIEPDTAELARDRVRNTQPPLPIKYAEQGVLL